MASTGASVPLRPVLRNRLLQVKTLHPPRGVAASPSRARRAPPVGVASAGQVSTTIAHAPSLYYFLQLKGGISFAESAFLATKGRLLANGKRIVDDSALRQQAPYNDIAALNLQILTPSGEPISILERRRHRTYLITHMKSSTGREADEADPRSYIHHIPVFPNLGGEALPVLIHAKGCVRGISGVGIVTDDVAAQQHLNADRLGSFGVFRVVFHRGTPSEKRDELERWCRHVFVERAADWDLLRDVRFDVTKLETESRFNPLNVDDDRREGEGNNPSHGFSPRHVSRSTIKALPSVTQEKEDEAIDITTDDFPYPVRQYIKTAFAPARMECVEFNGYRVDKGSRRPLELGESRRMSVEEVDTLLKLERQIKLNRLVHTLRATTV